MTGDPLAFTFRWCDYPAITADLPGTGGRIRVRPEDFEVREIPAYQLEGSGSHAYALVRKRGLTTRDLVLALQGQGLGEKEIGVAGLKDKYAVTEQWLSVPQASSQALDALERLPGVDIVERSRHRNKLGIGHLKGNRFTIRIRDTEAGAAARARAVLSELERRGLPNYFGPQRFGRFGRNAVDGLRVLQGDRMPGGHRLKRFFLSALQSLVFNRVVALRIERGLFETVVVGDWARKHETGGTFQVSDPQDSERAALLEISATVPLYGKKVLPSGGVPGEIEAGVLASLGLRWVDFTGRRGDRRFSRLALSDVEVLEEDGAVRLDFVLPKGSYATSLLREVMKVEVDEPVSREGFEQQGDGADRADWGEAGGAMDDGPDEDGD
ncbi:MAG: tRNA pseudouridine(13) synthase TruD [Trueperaceae bacterium]